MDSTPAASTAQPTTDEGELERSLLADLLESSKLYHTTDDYLGDFRIFLYHCVR